MISDLGSEIYQSKNMEHLIETMQNKSELIEKKSKKIKRSKAVHSPNRETRISPPVRQKSPEKISSQSTEAIDSPPVASGGPPESI